MKKIFFISLLLTFVLAASAQQSSNAYRRLADSLFDNHNYQTAATYYEKAIKNADQAGDIMLSIAECHTRMNHIGEAGEWFTKARENHATFNTNDVYEYVIVLMAQQKNNEAERELETLLSNDPNALHAKRLLDDLQHADKYYLDSAKLSVTALPFNTPVSEFAPAFYKDGIVFASSKTEGNSKRKYHWDNSDFLSLYYSIKSADGQFQNPVAFKKDLDSRYHDGPAAFYGGYEKMIMNRNKAYQVKEKKDTYIWYLSLYDGQYSSSADSWQLTSMPFDEPPYSIAHPSISEDGNILYFVSDRPGGYGGSDIYRVTKVNGVWSKPFNLGPMINSPGHDVFPFVIGNTLYFASNGHGGLGGLDIFKSTLNQNGFTPAINLGYPINSTADDFALITKDDGETGYFSSSRNGNDDLFAFDKRPDVVKMLAYIFDGVTKGPLPAASIQLITSTNEDKELSSDNDGYIHFELSRESAYVLIGSKDGKTGMMTGFAIAEEDQQHIIHQIPLFGDTSRIACIGTIENEVGQTQKAASITIVDKTTGEKINHDPGQSLISFMGEKGHSYSIEIQNEQGDVSTHELVIDPSATEAKTWKMVLTESSQAIGMAARIFNAENDQPLGGATVKIITFSEPDQELVADEKGIVDFTLQEGTAYVVVGSRENLTGMHSGIAEAGQEKLSVIHPVPAHGDPSSPLPVVALIADLQGKVLDEVTVTVTEKASGKSIPVKMKDGIVSFLGERGKEYDITATANGFQTASENVVISRDAAAVNKISMIMEKEVLPTPATFMMAARVFKAEDNSPLAGAKVTITSFVENEQELIAGNDGLVQFKSPEGSAYIIMASRDDYYGMYSGIADKGTEKSFMTHPVPTTKQSEKHVTVVAQVADANETSLKASDVVVKEKSSGKVVPVQLANGMVNFQGEKGKDYSITVDDKLHGLLSEEVNIPTDADQSAPIAVSLLGNSTRRSGNVASNNSSPANQVPVAGHIKNQEGVILDDVVVTVTDKGTGDKITNQFKNGLLNFSGEKGKIYIVSIQDKNQKSQLEEIEIPENADGIEKFDITLGQHQPMIYEVGAHLVDPETNQPMGGAIVTVVTADGDMELTADDNGLVTFRLPEGTDYIIIANKDNYSGMQSGIVEKGMG
ncbi:MAG TPA: tetratricopeptide repeat protein, partial [Cyclobacteriaceae bacterium]|nr:tetratricopeptide repeat protein [Cyclobacteriaceae bacterium]